MINLKSFFLTFILSFLCLASFGKPPCGIPPCGNGNGGGGGPTCFPPPCVPINKGIYFLLTAGVLYGAQRTKLPQLKNEISKHS